MSAIRPSSMNTQSTATAEYCRGTKASASKSACLSLDVALFAASIFVVRIINGLVSVLGLLALRLQLVVRPLHKRLEGC